MEVAKTLLRNRAVLLSLRAAAARYPANHIVLYMEPNSELELKTSTILILILIIT